MVPLRRMVYAGVRYRAVLAHGVGPSDLLTLLSGSGQSVFGSPVAAAVLPLVEV